MLIVPGGPFSLQTRTPADRLYQYLLRSIDAYEESGSGTQRPRSAAAAFAALSSQDFSLGPGWQRVHALVRFLDAPGIQDILLRELASADIDRSFHAALLLALLGRDDGLRLLERPPPMSASGIESGLALLARAALGRLDALELERRLDRVPNARAFGL